MVLPRKIREKVLEYYYGSTWRSIDWIAKEVGIPKSSVHNIVTAKKNEDPDFALVRFLVTNLKNEGIDVPKYARAIRISNQLDEYAIEQEDAELMIEELLASLYQEKWPIADAISTLHKFAEGAAEWRLTLFDYNMKHFEAVERLKEYNLEIEKEKALLAKFVQANKIVPNNFHILNKKFGDIDITENERAVKYYKQRYLALLKESRRADQGKNLDKNQLDELNKNLVYPLTEDQVLEKLDEVCHNPAKYWQLFTDQLWTTPISVIAEELINEKLEPNQAVN